MPGYKLPTHEWTYEGDLALEHGDVLSRPTFAYEVWGRLSPRRDNVVVVLHALSGSSHCFATPENPEPGWWQGLLAGSAPIHPDRHYIICSNLLGGCYGTTGPSSLDPRTSRRYGMSFPQITLRDMIAGHRKLLERLGVDRPVVLIGGSMGGMMALQWAVDHPREVRAVIALASPARSYPQMIALRAVQREAIINDPCWNRGDYDDTRFPGHGLALARKIGMITYRSAEEFQARFGRDMRDPRPHFLDGRFEVQSYLDHQGKKFVDRFDPNTYLYYSRAMDLHDLSRGWPSLADAAARVEARVLLVAFDTDILCPPCQVREVHEALGGAGRDSRMVLVETIHGHDAFLIELDAIRRAVDETLEGG